MGEQGAAGQPQHRVSGRAGVQAHLGRSCFMACVGVHLERAGGTSFAPAGAAAAVQAACTCTHVCVCVRGGGLASTADIPCVLRSWPWRTCSTGSRSYSQLTELAAVVLLGQVTTLHVRPPAAIDWPAAPLLPLWFQARTESTPASPQAVQPHGTALH